MSQRLNIGPSGGQQPFYEKANQKAFGGEPCEVTAARRLYGCGSIPDALQKYKAPEVIQNGKYAPQHPFRCLITAPSGAGKTTLLLSMLCSDNPDIQTKFTRIYVCAKDTEEPCYQYLRDTLEQIEELSNAALIKSGQEPDTIFSFVNDPGDLPKIDDLDPNERNIIVFDDCVLDLEGSKDRKTMNSFFMRARKKNCSMFFLSQSLFSDGLKFIRSNCDYFMLFPLGSGDTVRRAATELSIDPTEFAQVANIAWSDPHGWVYVNKRKPSGNITAGFA